MLTFCLAGILNLPDDLVEVPIDPLDLLGAGSQGLLGLQVATVGEDGPDLRALFITQVLDDLPSNLAVVEQLKTCMRPEEDLL